jgi:hypothetical protein
MLSDPQRQYAGTALRTIQIIVAALAAGVFAFIGVAIFLVAQNVKAAVPDPPILTYTSIGMAVAIVVSWLFVPSVVASGMKKAIIDGRSSDWGIVKSMPNAGELGVVVPLAVIYQTRTIIAAALLEGAAFFATVAYLIEHKPITLYVAIALAFLILAHIPTLSRFESWLDSEATSIEQMRQMR